MPRREIVKLCLWVSRFCRNIGCYPCASGSGFDTLFWRLKNDKKEFTRFVDVDFSSVTARKIRHIRKIGSDLVQHFKESRKYLLSIIIDLCLVREEQHCDLHCGDYHLVGADIRQWDELKAKLDSAQLDKDLPTFFLAE